MAEYAPGIPDKDRIVDLPKITAPVKWELCVQQHDADKRGRHFDLRLGDPTTGNAHSWALPATWPTPGNSIDIQVQPTHTLAYMDFKGKIPSGVYGAGSVSIKDRQRIEVTNSEPGHISFNVYRSSGPEEYTIHRLGGNTWRFYNRTVHRAKHPNIPNDKPKYKEKSLEQIDLKDDTKVLSAKIDGAHNLLYFPEPGKKVRLLSYRPTKRDTGVIEHTHKVPGLAGVLRSVKELARTVLRVETHAVNPKTKKATPSEQLAGMLNSDVWKSRAKQKQLGVLQNALIDVVAFKGKSMENAPYKDKMEVFKKVMEQHPGLFSLPPMAHTEKEKKKLLEKIRNKKLPLTEEGVVEWDLHQGGAPTKFKFKDDHDVYIKDIFEGDGKYKGKAAGGFTYSHTPNGPVVGKVGTGLNDALRKHMYDNPEKYKGMVAKIHAMKKMESGALFQPSFQGFHLDKNEQRRLDQVKLAFWKGFIKQANEELTDAQKAGIAGVAGTGTAATAISASNLIKDKLEDVRGFKAKKKRDFIKNLKPGDVLYSGYHSKDSPDLHVAGRKMPLKASEIAQLASGTPYYHAGVYLGKGRVGHAGGKDEKFKVTKLDKSMSGSRYKAYRPELSKKEVDSAVKYIEGLGKKKVKYKTDADTIAQGARMLFDPTGGPKTDRKTCKGVVCNTAVTKAYNKALPNEYAHVHDVRSSGKFKYLGQYNNIKSPALREKVIQRFVYPALRGLKWGAGAAGLTYAGSKLHKHLKEKEELKKQAQITCPKEAMNILRNLSAKFPGEIHTIKNIQQGLQGILDMGEGVNPQTKQRVLERAHKYIVEKATQLYRR